MSTNLQKKVFKHCTEQGINVVVRGILDNQSQIHNKEKTWHRSCFSIKTADGKVNAMSRDLDAIANSSSEIGDEVIAIGKENYYIKDKELVKSIDLALLFTINKKSVEPTATVEFIPYEEENITKSFKTKSKKRKRRETEEVLFEMGEEK